MTKVLFVFFVLLLAGGKPAQAASVNEMRSALIIGANLATGRPQLQYADDDARRIATVLEELGGFEKNEVQMLTDPTASEVLEAFSNWRERLLLAGRAQAELFFYYSGHADERGLLLGETLLSYSDLKAAVGSLPSRVRVVVLDACGTGTFTRSKGGRAVAPFTIDEAHSVRGHAFLTSSAHDEVSQESDRIGGSFFTHALLSGLRGAADLDGDRRVTLQEVYQFAFQETVKKTEQTGAGAQHPTYEIELQGRGGLMLTDLRDARATLAIASPVAGHFVVRDDRARLVAEFTKAPGHELRLALSNGAFELQMINKRGLRQGTFMARDEEVLLSNIPLQKVRTLWASAKGANVYEAIAQHNRRLRSLDTYRKRSLRLVKGGRHWGEPFYAFIGDKAVAIDREDFYVRIGDEVLQERYAEARTLKKIAFYGGLWTGIGGLTAVLLPIFGFAFGLGVVMPVLLPLVMASLALPLLVGLAAATILLIAAGIATSFTGASVALITSVTYADPIGFAEASKRVEAQNQNLAFTLGLSSRDVEKINAVRTGAKHDQAF